MLVEWATSALLRSLSLALREFQGSAALQGRRTAYGGGTRDVLEVSDLRYTVNCIHKGLRITIYRKLLYILAKVYGIMFLGGEILC